MNIRFILPGKNKEPSLSALYAEYLKRLSKFAKCSLTFIKEISPKSSSMNDISSALDKEAAIVLNMLKRDDYLILVDVHADMVTSQDFAKKMEQICSLSNDICFVIGSSNGLSDKLRRRANFAVSLSKLTFTHYHALLLILEQVYRSFLILNNHPYDK